MKVGWKWKDRIRGGNEGIVVGTAVVTAVRRDAGIVINTAASISVVGEQESQ